MGLLRRKAWTLALLMALSACGDEGPGAEPLPTLTSIPIRHPVLEVVAKGLQMPVALAPAPDGRLFFAEVTGRIRVIESNGHLLETPVATLSVARPPGYSEHGLLGLALHPQFPQEPYLYAFHTVPDHQGRPASQRVVRFRLGGNSVVQQDVIIDGLPTGRRCCHNGGRLAFGPDGMLYVTLGDAEARHLAQDPATLEGTLLRLAPDGSVPPDNPFPGSPVFAYGLRNVFGIAFHPGTGELWVSDNGPSGGDGPRGHDELNIIVAGGNYGWPLAFGLAQDPRFIDPVYDSGPIAIVPTGMTIYWADALPFRGDLLFCSWSRETLLRIPALQMQELRNGLRRTVDPMDTGYPCSLDVKQGPDGSLYLSDDTAIYRLGPREER